MLVFQKTDPDHILIHGCERAGIDPKWIVETIDEINTYLPEDWCISRANNNFIIQIVGKHGAKIVGNSYRLKDGKTLHRIDTILLKEYLNHFNHPITLSKKGKTFSSSCLLIPPKSGKILSEFRNPISCSFSISTIKK